MEDNINIADELDALQAAENDGRGIDCVREIIEYLRRDQYDLAKNVRHIEGDKTRAYPKVEARLYEIFGCRLHGVNGCGKWLCKRA